MARTSKTGTSTVTINSETAEVNYEEYAGDTIIFEYGYCDSETLEPYDLTGWDAFLEIRENVPNGTLLVRQDTTNELLELNHDNANGFNIRSLISTDILGVGTFKWYVVLTDPLGIVNTLVRGKITLGAR
jgi:hypothetical protein